MEHGAGRCPHGASSAWRNIRPRIRSDGITPLALRENPFGTGPTRFASGFTDQASSGWRVSWRGRPPSGMGDGTSTKSGVARNLPKTRPDSSSRVGFGHAVRRSGAPGGLARSVPSTLFHSSTGTASVQPAPDQRRPAAAGWITGPSQIDGTCETWALCADRSVIPSAPATAGRSGSAGGSCAVQAQTSKVRRKAGSTILRILLLPFRICFFIIHVFVLTAGLMTIAGALGFWWVANHQKEANEMAVTALEYMETNKERLKPVMDFLEPAIDSLLPPKVKTGPGKSKDPPGTPSH